MQRHRVPIGDGRLSIAIEDYLRAIIILEDAGEAPSTAHIARRLGFAYASVTQMVQRLATLGLVDYLPYRALRLTAEGRRAAEVVLRRHQLMCTYLERELGFAPPAALAEADRLEHAMSPELCRRIEQRLLIGHDPRF